METPSWRFESKDLPYFIFRDDNIFKWLPFLQADDRREFGFWFIFHVSSYTQSNTWQEGVAVRQRCLRHSAFSLALQQLAQPGHKEASRGPYVSPYGVAYPGWRLWGFPSCRLVHLEGAGPSADTRPRAGAGTRSCCGHGNRSKLSMFVHTDAVQRLRQDSIQTWILPAGL